MRETIVMEPVSQGETYYAETIGLPWDITGATLERELRNEKGEIVKEWSSDTPDSIVINNAAKGRYTVPKWNVELPAGVYTGKDKITYANGDVDVLWNLTLSIS